MSGTRPRATVEKRPLADALASRYPRLTPDQRRRAEDMVIAQVAEAIREGREVAFLEHFPDGAVEISVLILDEIVSRVTGGMRAR